MRGVSRAAESKPGARCWYMRCAYVPYAHSGLRLCWVQGVTRGVGRISAAHPPASAGDALRIAESKPGARCWYMRCAYVPYAHSGLRLCWVHGVTRGVGRISAAHPPASAGDALRIAESKPGARCWYMRCAYVPYAHSGLRLCWVQGVTRGVGRISAAHPPASAGDALRIAESKPGARCWYMRCAYVPHAHSGLRLCWVQGVS